MRSKRERRQGGAEPPGNTLGRLHVNRSGVRFYPLRHVFCTDDVTPHYTGAKVGLMNANKCNAR